MFWASSYNLFVTWAPSGQHPWDALPGSHGPAATLEIGALRGHSNKVLSLPVRHHFLLWKDRCIHQETC